MDKKIIQLLFANICDKNDLRPVMNGVHFESERCYASDGHVLVIYGEGNPKLAGKTMSASGEVIDGRYPNVDGVFPPVDKYGTKLNIDIRQLHAACVWHQKQADATEHDGVVINGVSYNVRSLRRILEVMVYGGANGIKFYNSQPDRATVILGNKLKGLLMPQQYEESGIDGEREFEESPRTFSYENFINEYVFNSWRKEPKKEPLTWLD